MSLDGAHGTETDSALEPPRGTPCFQPADPHCGLLTAEGLRNKLLLAEVTRFAAICESKPREFLQKGRVQGSREGLEDMREASKEVREEREGRR